VRQGHTRRAGEGAFVRRVPLDELDDPAELGPPPLLPPFGTAVREAAGAAPGPAAATAPPAMPRPCAAGARATAGSSTPDAGTPLTSARRRRGSVIRRGQSSRWRFGVASSTANLAASVGRKRWRRSCSIRGSGKTSAGRAGNTAKAECERRRAATAQRTYEAKQAVWYDERARVLAAVDLLPPEEQTQLRTIAARGLAGMRLTPEAPLYVMNLVRVYKAMYEH